ncbi:hypothetical protein I4U23_004104 [Adineta vaga]|nr:hypothetical protein I4U23_004104 [Adineta vaga]
MIYKIKSKTQKNQEIDKILDTFRDHFWLNKHRWSVQCNWHPDQHTAHFYTLPYAFEGYSCSEQYLSKTTCPYENKSWSYHSLIISLTNDDMENNRNQLQNVLHQIHCLLTLYIRQKPMQVLDLLSFDNKDLATWYFDLLKPDQWYNSEQCMKLSQLTFITHCKALAIAVDDRTSVVNIVTTLNNLQALSVLCQDDKWNLQTTSTTFMHDTKISRISTLYSHPHMENSRSLFEKYFIRE